MHELFEISLETFNLIQLSEWIKKCRSAIKLSDNLSYTENPCRYQEEVSAFCESYIDFLEKNKPIVNSKLFEHALKLSVMPKPRYVLVSKEQIEIDVTDAMEELQLANQITSNLVSKSIDRELGRVKNFSREIETFTSGKREALYDIIDYLSIKTTTYKIGVLETAENLSTMGIKKALRDIKRGKWQLSERTLETMEFMTISYYLTTSIRANHINKNIFYSFVKNKEQTKARAYGKRFLCNVGFYIGLTVKEMEQVLRNEGHTIQCSLRGDDTILYKSFYYFFSREYASAFLSKDGFLNLDIGK